nr:hypothetical protein [Chitinophaga rhizosphaerae]
MEGTTEIPVTKEIIAGMTTIVTMTIAAAGAVVITRNTNTYVTTGTITMIITDMCDMSAARKGL